MKMYQKTGFNRLAKLIALLGFITTYITLIVVDEYRVSADEAFLEYPIDSIVAALGAFILTRLVYWVVDGFSESSDENV